jgi:hypothetical protein
MLNGRCKLHGGKSTGPRTPEGAATKWLSRAHGRFQVDVHLNFCCRLLHWQIGSIGTFQNSPGVESDEPMSIRNIGAVTIKPSASANSRYW